jgi:hypothetical protein
MTQSQNLICRPLGARRLARFLLAGALLLLGQLVLAQENRFEFSLSLTGWDEVQRARDLAWKELGQNWKNWAELGRQYGWLEEYHLAVWRKTHPIFDSAAKVERQFNERTRQWQAHEEDHRKLVEEYERYRAAAATATPDQRAHFESWYRRIEEWNERVKARAIELDREKERIERLNRDLQTYAGQVGAEWTRAVDAYLALVRSEIRKKRLAEVEAKILQKRKQIRQDQSALSRYLKDSAVYVTAIEEAAALAEDARREAAWTAAIAAFDMAVAGQVRALKGAEAIRASQIQQLEKLMVRYDVPHARLAEWVSQWRRGESSLRAIRTQREYLEFLDTANASLKGVNESVRGRYAEALWNGLSLVANSPGLKLMMVNGEVYTGLAYLYWAHKSGKALVGQLFDHAPERLKAVKALTATCEKHVKELLALKKERERIKGEEIRF